DVRAEPVRERELRADDLLDVERLEAVDALEPDVLLRHGELELLAQDLRVQQVLHADADARRLVGVRRPDPAPRRPDLQAAETTFARTVERDVPRHDQVRVPRDEQEAARLVAPGLELVELRDEHPGIDDAPGPDGGALPGDEAGRDLTD